MPLLILPLVLLAACAGPEKPAGDDTGCAPADRGTWYADADGDGFGDPGTPVEACSQPPATTTDATDCDDAAAAVHPGAEEIWYDGADEDCSGGSDFDQDGDGYDRAEECDDLDPARYPDAAIPEVWYDGVDDNCDGNDGDRDGDGFYLAGYPFEVPAGFAPGDCQDDPAVTSSALNGFADVPAAEVHSGAAEAWYDGVDADCAGDDDFDQDGDGFRTGAWPDDAGALGDDCADRDADVHPGATDDWYDGVDADCAGNDDFDQDYDGVPQDLGDCDDTSADVRPGAVEDCSTSTDEDCDGGENGANMAGCTNFYLDNDGDGYGTASRCLCVAEGAYLGTAGGDCDDADARVLPGGVELCDGMRNDCSNPRWSETAENLVVSLEDPSGAWSDLSVEWNATTGTPVRVTLPADGTVWVCGGSYYATVEGPSGAGDVRVVGRYGADRTSVYALGTGPVLTVAGSGVSVALEGLTLTGGSASYGGGVYMTDATVSLTGCIVQANRAQYGGGLYVDGGSLTIDTTRIVGNATEIAGGGVYALDAEVAITTSELSTNTASGSSSAGGGGMAYTARGAESLLVTDTVLADNSVAAGGTYAQGGGVYVAATGSGAVTLERLTVTGNTVDGAAYAYGGGLRVELGGTTTGDLADLWVEDNSVGGDTLAYGGGMYAYQGSSGPFVLDTSTVMGSTLYGGAPAGGGIYLAGASAGPVTISGTEVTANRILNVDQAAEAGGGGGVYVALNGATATLEAVQVTGNSAASGDGIELTTRANARLTLVDSEVSGNAGYGISYAPYDMAGGLDLTDSRVTDHAYDGVYVIAGTGYAATIECSGDAGVDAGIYGNGLYGVRAYCASAGGSCLFTGSRCDMGTPSLGTDNTSGDYNVDGATVGNWYDDATFSCTNGTCS